MESHADSESRSPRRDRQRDELGGELHARRAGRIDTKTEVIGGVTTSERYTYHAAGRLSEVYANGASTPSETFTYDANGNRSDGTYDTQDRQLMHGGFAFTYTNNGERLTKRDTATGAIAQYRYDTEGISSA